MTAPALTERFAGERTGRHLAGLVVVAVVIVSVAAAARTPVAARVFADWLAAALPAAGFAVAGAVVGHLWRSHPLLARTPESVLTLSATAEWVRPGIADRVAGLYAAAVVSPVVVAAAVVAFEGDDRPILVCAWLLTALCAAAGATWSVAPVFGRGADRATAPVGHVRTGGTTLVAGETLDPIAPVVIALRAAALGTGVAALASGVLPDAAVAWMSGRPAAAAAYAIVIALVAAPGAEAGCFAAGAFAAFGPAAVIAFAATAAVCDARSLRLLQMLVGRGVAWRSAVSMLPVVYAGAVWSGVLLR